MSRCPEPSPIPPALRQRLAAALLGLLGALPSAQAAAAGRPVAPAPATAGAVALIPATAEAWWQRFDDPVLAALVEGLSDPGDAAAQPLAVRRLALARHWVAVRVFQVHALALQAWLDGLRQLQQQQMDSPPGSDGREAALSQLAQALAAAEAQQAERLARRDAALDAVATLAGMDRARLHQQLAAAPDPGRLPHVVAEPPALRVTVSAETAELARRLGALHDRHAAARQAERQLQALDRALASQAADPGPSAPEALLRARVLQAGSAGDLALAWLDWFEAGGLAEAPWLEAQAPRPRRVATAGR